MIQSNIILSGKVFRQFDEKYFISEDGEVYSAISNKILKPDTTQDGYLRVGIHGKHRKIHRLVYEAWIRPLNEGEQVNHKDDNKLNNHYDNLYVGTQKENIQDCVDNNHRVGNMFYMTIRDKERNIILTFCPSSDFFLYDGHKSSNGCVQRFFSRNWFKKRYDLLELKKISSLEELLKLKGVTTIPDECKEVG